MTSRPVDQAEPRAMKKPFMSGVLAVALAALAGLPATAAGQGSRRIRALKRGSENGPCANLG